MFKKATQCRLLKPLVSLISPYNAAFMPNDSETLPNPLTVMYNEQRLNCSFQELLEKSEELIDEITITTRETELIEEATRGQSTCIVSFEHRAGCVTASNFKVACTTNSDKRSRSLIKMICYRNSLDF